MSWRIVSMSLLVVLASGLRCALDQARWSAATDGLTGVLNKGAFTRRLGPLVAQAQRRGDSLVVCYIDLDGFKGVNDGFGHAAGDKLLCQFSEAAVNVIRAHDLFARIGGDEFIALLTVASCPQGDTAAERLHDRLSRILRDIGHDVTCSVGALVLDSRQVTLPERAICCPRWEKGPAQPPSQPGQYAVPKIRISSRTCLPIVRAQTFHRDGARRSEP